MVKTSKDGEEKKTAEVENMYSLKTQKARQFISEAWSVGLFLCLSLVGPSRSPKEGQNALFFGGQQIIGHNFPSFGMTGTLG